MADADTSVATIIYMPTAIEQAKEYINTDRIYSSGETKAIVGGLLDIFESLSSLAMDRYGVDLDDLIAQVTSLQPRTEDHQPPDSPILSRT